MKRLARATLAIALEGEAPARELLLFKAGWNDTEKGRFLFDSAAARSVMSAYSAHNVDRMIDLEHLSLDEEAPNFDPDARGWTKLELRNGELWAVEIGWTPDGAARLQNKTQRYLSPTFTFDKKTRRVSSIHNIALTAVPATHDAQPLIAATVRDARLATLSTGPSLDDIRCAVQAALDDLYPSDDSDPSDGAWICDLYDATAVYQAEGQFFEAPYTYDGSIATLGAPVEVRRIYQPIANPTPDPEPPEPSEPQVAAMRLALGSLQKSTRAFAALSHRGA